MNPALFHERGFLIGYLMDPSGKFSKEGNPEKKKKAILRVKNASNCKSQHTQLAEVLEQIGAWGEGLDQQFIISRSLVWVRWAQLG